MHVLTAIIEKWVDTSYYVRYVPNIPGAHTQAETLGELSANLHEVIAMLLEDGYIEGTAEFIGTQQVMVA